MSDQSVFIGLAGDVMIGRNIKILKKIILNKKNYNHV